jgi:dephospho-CoA kinase
MDIEEKKKLADYVIDNSGSIEETKRQVKEILERIIFSMHQQKEKSG